jgi:uncharacterized protein YdiU (UPF0061 family)
MSPDERETTLNLANRLLNLMERSQADFTITWRQLAHVLEEGNAILIGNDNNGDDARLIAPLLRSNAEGCRAGAFYKPLNDGNRGEWTAWIRDWLSLLREHTTGDSNGVAARMRAVSPKYVAREWMLVAAYTAAKAGDYAPISELHELLRRPYDEQPEFEARFYQRAPASVYEGVGLAGTNFMS